MAAETGFMIDGVLYEMPSLDSFTMDDAQVLYDYSGLALDDFVPPEDEQDEGADLRLKLKNPGFLRALMHIAYQRGNPKMNTAKVKALIGAANLITAIEHLDDGEDDAAPLASTTEPEQSSPNDSVASNEHSGNDSEKSSDEPVIRLAPTTTTESDTSSTSDPASSVA